MSTSRRQFGPLFRQLAEPWIAAVGTTDGPKLRQLLQLVASRDEFALSEALAIAYPEFHADQATALARFRSFRERINSLAADTGLGFALATDSGRGDPAKRRAWFTGPDLAAAGARALADASTLDVKDRPLTPNRAFQIDEHGRRVVRYFLCYVRAEQTLTSDLVARFEKLDGGTGYNLKRWEDKMIEPGEKWHEAIQASIQSCDVALVMLSPSLLDNTYVGAHEIPNFALDLDRPGEKPVIPVGLRKISLKHCVISWVKDRQFVRIEKRDGTALFYSDLTTEKQKDAFAQELFDRLHAKLDRLGGDAPLPPPASSPRPPAAASLCPARPHDFLKVLPEGMADRDHIKHYEPTRAIVQNLAENQSLQPQVAAPSAPEGEDALAYLLKWSADPEARPCLAVLGEYGIGKTTTLKHFTRRLLEQAKTDPATPPPIYIDLRLPQWRPEAAPATVAELLTEVIRRNWRLAGPPTVTPDELLRLVREERAILIFDGLDEKIVHLPPREVQGFIRLLWQALPPEAFAPRAKDAPPPRHGRLVISCRSQYFRDLASQNALLTGEDREGLARAGTPSLCLLPFNEQQIRSYLAALYDGDTARAEAACTLIDSIHNLRDLAARPYLLSVITERLTELEALRARGETVNSARLYQLFTERWLARDDGKHTLEPAHKREIMEHLAAAFWREGAREWDVDRLEVWFDELLLACPRIASAYAGKERAILKEDLRTATFVLRPDAEERHFRFAHTSLLEFFLAARLWRALSDGTAAATWDLPEPSAETFVFLGELLALERNPAPALRALETLLGAGVLPAGRHAFQLWRLARERGWPQPAPARVALPGVDLEGWRIAGRSAAEPLRLRGADLSGAWLGRTRWEHVELGAADLTGARAPEAEFQHVRLRDAVADEALLSPSVFRDCDVAGLSVAGTDLDGAAFIRTPNAFSTRSFPAPATSPAPAGADWVVADHRAHQSFVNSCAWSPDGTRLLSASADNTLKIWDARDGACLLTLSGHQSGVNGCAWSPDGTRLLSASGDKTLRIWDARNGACLLTLSGHQSEVKGCAWSPDGSRLLSASFDSTLKVWDARDGSCLLFLAGHPCPVNACAWSPDGSRLLSASIDCTLKIWDARDGSCLLSLAGHQNSVIACAWSTDGSLLLSASLDGTLKIWDVRDGSCLRSLSGHQFWIWSCAWSPDGSRVLSTATNYTLKVWDAHDGSCLLSLSGHQGPVTACAWSPDGFRVLSSSYDNTLKIWDARDGHCLLSLSGHQASVRACACSPDGSLLLSAATDYTLKVWDASDGACLLTLSGHQSEVNSCVWSPDDYRLLSASDDKFLRIWDARDGSCMLTLSGHQSGVKGCAWSPDGSRLLSASDDKTLKIWDARDGSCLLTLSGHQLCVNDCAWSPDGSRVLSVSGDNKLKIWDSRDGACLFTLAGHQNSVIACVWSPDGSLLLSASDDKTLKIWDAHDGECLRSLSGHRDSVRACVWSPDGTRLLSGSSDNTLKVWDARDGACLLTLSGHQSWVQGCAWSPDGTRVLSASSDGTMREWDAATGAPLAVHWHFRDGSAATTVPGAGLKGIRWASPGAWRHLRWYGRDAAGEPLVLPAEAFGPLP